MGGVLGIVLLGEKNAKGRWGNKLECTIRMCLFRRFPRGCIYEWCFAGDSRHGDKRGMV